MLLRPRTGALRYLNSYMKGKVTMKKSAGMMVWGIVGMLAAPAGGPWYRTLDYYAN